MEKSIYNKEIICFNNNFIKDKNTTKKCKENLFHHTLKNTENFQHAQTNSHTQHHGNSYFSLECFKI